MIPVVLAFPWPKTVYEDEASGGGFYTRLWVESHEVLVWDGAGWQPLEGLAGLQLSQAIEFEEIDGEVLEWFKNDEDNPLANPTPIK